MIIITEEQLNLYMSLFKGRENIYARRWEKGGESGMQYIGRILRSGETKYIYDYRDKKIEFLEKLFRKREKYYKKLIY